MVVLSAAPARPLLRLSRAPSRSLIPLHAPRCLHLRTFRRFPRPRVSSSSPSSSAAAGIPVEEIIERDWSFLAADPADSGRADKACRIISAAGVEGPGGSRVLAALPTVDFIDRVVESARCELLVAIHESLFVLAMIKENHDHVRCWQGGVDIVPEKFAPFDVVFLCYFPGMGVSVDHLLKLLAPKCSPGARVVLSFDEGREVVEKNHRLQFPDMVTSDLPDRAALEQAATENSFQITEFVDEPTFYLAVLRFQQNSTQ